MSQKEEWAESSLMHTHTHKRGGGIKAEVRKMENLFSLGSQRSAELNLTRKMTLRPFAQQPD